MIVLIAALVLIALFTPSLPYPEAEEPIASWVGATESRGCPIRLSLAISPSSSV